MSPSLATTATAMVVLMVASMMATVRSHVALEEIASFRQLGLRFCETGTTKSKAESRLTD